MSEKRYMWMHLSAVCSFNFTTFLNDATGEKLIGESHDSLLVFFFCSDYFVEPLVQ
jgi:hypothetical protein